MQNLYSTCRVPFPRPSLNLRLKYGFGSLFYVCEEYTSTFSIFDHFYDGGPYHIETSPLICRANQWTGFYMIGTSTIKELIYLHITFDPHSEVQRQELLFQVLYNLITEKK